MFAPARVPSGRGRYFYGANGEQMEQYLIEIQNTSHRLVMLTCPAKAPLMLLGADNGREPVRVPLTSEQFLSMAYDLEGHIEGKHGVPKSLALFITDRASGRCEPCPFEAGQMVAEAGLSADAHAVEAQAKQDAATDAQRAKANASAQPDTDTLAGAMQAGLNTLE